MGENNFCRGCIWNEYPICKGFYRDGNFKFIDNLKPIFICGQKNKTEQIIKISKVDIFDRIIELENRIIALESRTIQQSK